MPEQAIDTFDLIRQLRQFGETPEEAAQERAREEERLAEQFKKSSLSAPNEVAGILTGMIGGLRQLATAATGLFAPEFSQRQAQISRALIRAQQERVSSSDMGGVRRFVNKLIPDAAGSIACGSIIGISLLVIGRVLGQHSRRNSEATPIATGTDHALGKSLAAT